MSVIEAALVALTCTGCSTTSLSGFQGHTHILSAGAALLRSTLQASDLPDAAAVLVGPPKPVLLQHPKHRPLWVGKAPSRVG
jgi:hypothetical protein